MSLSSELAHLSRHAGAAEFWFASCFAVALAAAAVVTAFVFINRKRVIEDLPTALIRSASQGYVELQGRAELMDGDTLYADLTRRMCVWYEYKVEKRQKSGSGNSAQHSWVTVNEHTSDTMFYLVDPTGRCAVDPDGATVTPNRKNVWYGMGPIPGSYNKANDEWWSRALGSMGKPYRYTESRIEPGDELYALGDFTTHGSTYSGFDFAGAVGDRLREWKRDQKFVLRNFDTNRDGEINMQEWQAARARAQAEVEHEHLPSSAPPPVDVLARTRDRRRPFVIHAGTEEEIVARYQRYAALLLCLGIPLLVTAVWSMGLRLTAS